MNHLNEEIQSTESHFPALWEGHNVYNQVLNITKKKMEGLN